MIPANKSFLAPFEEVEFWLKKVWDNQILTNNGPLVQLLEERLKVYLGVKHLFLVGNGTIALEIAVETLEKKGEIITSAFSFVAAPAAITRGGCKPVFADIDPYSKGIDIQSIESLISDKTVAIFPTHMYGNCCDVFAIEELAQKYNLKVIYDAAHAFGTEIGGRSVMNYGDISALSFHAFKIFHTVEGGALICKDDEVAERIYQRRYFGMDGQGNYHRWGVNGKTSELNAAVGLANLDHFEMILQNRKKISLYYQMLIEGLPISIPETQTGSISNCAYFPVFFEDESVLLRVKKGLETNQINTKRYFHPALNKLPMIREKVSIAEAEQSAATVLCLPNYFGLEKKDQIRIVQIIKSLL